jgi:transposase
VRIFLPNGIRVELLPRCLRNPFPKSNASPELMAEITVSKFLDGLPFYRQEQIWKHQDIDSPRATQA